MPHVRLLPFESLSGAANMAADEVLLQTASSSGIASLRFYTWAVPTVSLGYFQPAADRLLAPASASLPWVRRATGGAALIHHHELTYALALPPGKPWQDHESDWVCPMHGVIARALNNFGSATTPVTCGQEKKTGPFLCFLHQTVGDLTAAAAKVVGSARRKQKGATIQHGGILLAQSPHAPELPGLQELTGIAPDPHELARTIVREFEQSTGWKTMPGAWTDEELVQREVFERERYNAASWNEKR